MGMPWLGRKLQKDERGLTLPEVLTVVAILGILIAIAIIIWLGLMEQRRVDAAANQLAADLRLAHTSATNQLTDWRVVVTVPGAEVSGEEDPEAPKDWCEADYCMVRLDAVYTEGSDPPETTITEQRELPEGTKVLFTTDDDDDPSTTVPADPKGTGTVAPSIKDSTRTVEFNADGTARALGSPSGTFVVSSLNENTRRGVIFLSATSRVRID